MQDDNLKYEEQTIFDVLESLRKPEPEFKLWTDIFLKKDEIVLAKDSDSGFVGARSLVIGMGLSWPRQYRKFKKNALFHCPRATATFDGNIFTIQRGVVEDYLQSIDLKRLPEETASSVQKYQRYFPEFMGDQLETTKDRIASDEYIDTDGGMERLIIDSICLLQNQGAIKLVSSVLTDLMKADDLTPKQLKLTDAIYDLADLAARNRNRLKGAA